MLPTTDPASAWSLPLVEQATQLTKMAIAAERHGSHRFVRSFMVISFDSIEIIPALGVSL
jgi:hypothetical protein